MSVCTLADIKDRLGIADTDTDNDTTINTIIASLAALFDTYCNRSLIVPASAVTEYYTAYSAWLRLRRYPLVSITSIKESYTFEFDDAMALVADTDYRVIDSGSKAVLLRLYGTWPLIAPDAIQVVYRGGYAAAGATPGTGETALPADLREAAIEQATFIFKRRLDIGLSAQSFDGGSINKFSSMDLLPLVKQILDTYKRTVL